MITADPSKPCSKGHQLIADIFFGERSVTHEGKQIYHCPCGTWIVGTPEEAERDRGKLVELRDLATVEEVVFQALEKRLNKGESPTPLELQKDCSITLVAVKGALHRLVQKGWIHWSENAYRSIQITDEVKARDAWKKNLRLIPASERVEPPTMEMFD